MRHKSFRVLAHSIVLAAVRVRISPLRLVFVEESCQLPGCGHHLDTLAPRNGRSDAPCSTDREVNDQRPAGHAPQRRPARAAEVLAGAPESAAEQRAVAAAFEHTWASLTVAGRSLVASIVLRLDMRILGE